ncbi:hypothetical protein F5Y00DRAFT_244316 [Daldinia vernicosa]|uniref:uncharacterized protein n=1 Tax=Daldinia vernicosa TaxID=114800 RepID=UPI002008D8F0|nr:uncharacterized protein F5Y00DRAFT_244316 [Daldinia vernicosa]KAI0846202.1 hypothetical protein F5Y00DRAFT_244316 [Daldinia vernicosa]
MPVNPQARGDDAQVKPFTYDEEVMEQWKKYKDIVCVHNIISNNSGLLRPCNFKAAHARTHTKDDLEIVKGVADPVTYWKTVIADHMIAPWKNFERVMISLGDIVPGVAVTESSVYKSVRKQLDKIADAIKEKEPSDIAPALTNEWPSPEDIEAIRIYGDAKMGFGYLPVGIVNRLAKAKLTHLLYEPNTSEGTPDDFWAGVMQAQSDHGENILEDGNDDDDDTADQLLGQDVHDFTEELEWATDKYISDGVGAVDQKYREVIMTIRSEFSSKLNNIMAECTAAREEAFEAKEEAAKAKKEVDTLKDQLRNIAENQDAGGSGLDREEVQALIMDSFKAFLGSKELYDVVINHFTNHLASEEGTKILRDAATSEDVVKALKIPVLNMVKPDALAYVKNGIQDSLPSHKSHEPPAQKPQTPAPNASWMNFTPLQQKETQGSLPSAFGPKVRKLAEEGSQTQSEKDKRRKK